MSTRKRTRRWLALVVGVVTLAGLAVGVVARRAYLASERDEELVAAVDHTVGRITAFSDTVGAAALAASTPAEVRTAVLAEWPDAMVEVEPAVGQQPVPSQLELGGGPARVAVSAVGPEFVVVAKLPSMAVVGDSITAHPKVAVLLDRPRNVAVTPRIADGSTQSAPRDAAAPAGAETFRVIDGIRHYTEPALPGVVVVAEARNHLTLPWSERLLVAGLGLAALALVGFAVVGLLGDHRRLLAGATIDPLTRLPNRVTFGWQVDDLIERAGNRGAGFAFVMFDLNGFKAINDNYGHSAGDEVLRVVGRRLGGVARSTDPIARWGGDEFVAVLDGVEDEATARRRCADIEAAIAEPIRLDKAGAEVQVGAAIGVAFWPQHGDTLAALLEVADAAMYTAKRDEGEVVVTVAGPRPAVMPEFA